MDDGASPVLRPVVLADDGRHHAFPHVVSCANGDLLAAWRVSSGHRIPDGTIWTSRSSDGGRRWTAPRETVRGPHDSRDPCLATLTDGRLSLSWFGFDGTRSTGVHVSISVDDGASFPQDVVLPEVWSRWTAVSAPVVPLPDGILVLPVYGRDGTRSTELAILASSDAGRSWTLRSRISPVSRVIGGLSEPWIVADEHGLTCFVRTESHTTLAYRSSDEGNTWASPVRLFPSDSRVAWLRTAGGRSIAVHRSVEGKQAVLRTSDDDWGTWSAERVIDAGGHSTYAGLAKPATGGIVVVWSMEAPDGRTGRLLGGRLAG
jgi:hypothetical protein